MDKKKNILKKQIKNYEKKFVKKNSLKNPNLK